MYYVYILKSIKDGRTYVGYSKDVRKRFIQHNAGLEASTKYRRPFVVLKVEECETISEAKRKERYWKSGAGRRMIKNLYYQD